MQALVLKGPREVAAVDELVTDNLARFLAWEGTG